WRSCDWLCCCRLSYSPVEVTDGRNPERASINPPRAASTFLRAIAMSGFWACARATACSIVYVGVARVGMAKTRLASNTTGPDSKRISSISLPGPSLQQEWLWLVILYQFLPDRTISDKFGACNSWSRDGRA